MSKLSRTSFLQFHASFSSLSKWQILQDGGTFVCVANNGVDIHIHVWRISSMSSKFKRGKRGCSHVTAYLDSRPLQAFYSLNEKPHHDPLSHKAFLVPEAHFIMEKISGIKLR